MYPLRALSRIVLWTTCIVLDNAHYKQPIHICFFYCTCCNIVISKCLIIFLLLFAVTIVINSQQKLGSYLYLTMLSVNGRPPGFLRFSEFLSELQFFPNHLFCVQSLWLSFHIFLQCCYFTLELLCGKIRELFFSLSKIPVYIIPYFF